jgi:Carboxypeptidase regulatory-like domain
MTRLNIAVALAVALLAPGIAFAQASIAGAVRDTSGGLLPGVTVEASSPALIERVRTVVTDGTGQYRIVDLRPGTYTVTFSLPGFNVVKREGIELTGSFTATVNVELRVGALEETITVTGETPVVDIQNTTQQRVVGREVIDAVPTGRLYQNMAVLIPGMSVSGGFSGSAQDVGGSVGDVMQGLAIHGGRTGDQRVTLDGLSTANAEGSGQFTAWAPNMSSTQEMTVDTSASSAEASTGGVRINIIPREGGNAFRGTFFATAVNSAFQGSNYSEDLRQRGLRTPNSIKHEYDVNPGFGGPIVRDRLWFYVAARWNGVHNYVGGDVYSDVNAGNPDVWTYTADLSKPGVIKSDYRNANARLTWQANQKKLSVAYDDSYRCQCPRTVAGSGPGPVTPESAPFYRFPFQRLATVNWTSPATSRLLLEAGASNRGERWQFQTPSQSDPFAHLIPVQEQSTGLWYRGRFSGPPEPFANALAGLTNIRGAVSYITGAHALKAGVTETFGFRDSLLTDNDGNRSYRFNNGVPNLITLRATPYRTIARSRADLGAYVQDKWTVRRATLNLGVRFDYYSNYFPEQTLGPAPLAPTRNLTLPETPWSSYKDITPRLGLSYDVFGNGRTALKATLNKYVQAISINGGAGANPVSRIANQTTRSWADADRDFVPDCDLISPVANGECGAMANANFGRPTPTTQIDPATVRGWGERPYNWETSASVQHELAPRVSVEAGYFRRWYGNFTVVDNRAVTAADFTTYSITAPTDPRLPDGGGQVIGGLFDLNPARVGQVDNYQTFAGEFGSQVERWHGIDLGVNTRVRGGVLLQGGISTGNTLNDTCEIRAALPETATTNPYCRTESGFLTQVKVLGSYVLPRIGVMTSATFQSIPGPQLAANYVASSASIAPSLGRPLSGGAANATINLIEPGTLYGERLNQLDLRFSRPIRFGRTTTQLNLDVFNALNSNAILAENPSFAVWRQPQTLIMARFAKISVQVDF